MIYDVFLSYEWQSKLQVDKLEKNLKSNQINVWKRTNYTDQDESLNNLKSQIANIIKKSESFICCLTKKYCQSYYILSIRIKICIKRK